MNYIIRKTLFIFFVLLFVIAAPALILYAQGYRLNLPYASGTKLVVKTGGVFVNASPKQADIYINGSLSKQTDFIFGRALIENLLPRKYNIEVKKNGYQTWSKSLEVKEKEVTAVRNILLVPENIIFTLAEENIDDILESPDKTKLALRGRGADGWNLRVYDLAAGITIKLADQGDFSAKDAALTGWEWTDDSASLNVPVAADGKTVNYYIATDKTPAVITKINEEERDEAEKNTPPISELAKDTAGNAGYSLMADGYIYRKADRGEPAKASEAKMEIDAAAAYKLRVFQDYYFVEKGNELYVLAPGTDRFKKIFDGLAADIELSPDGQKVVYASDSEVWVFFLDDKTDPPAARAGEEEFIIRLSEKISDCHWLNTDHLIFIAGQTLKTAETDNRDRVNIFDLAKIGDVAGSDQARDGARLFWDGRNGAAYIFAGTKLFRSVPIE